MNRKNLSPAARQPARRNKPLDRVYDVFLSHRFSDAALVEELNEYIEQTLHYEAYVDWKDSREDLDREHVSRDTAEYLRRIMRHAASLIFVVGPEAAGSKWMPWELGFFDGRQSARRIAIYLPDGVALPEKQEYLGIYPVLRKEGLADFLADATIDVAAMDSATSDQWLRHMHRALTRPDDYWLSVLQWQFGFAANLLTRDRQPGLLPDNQPGDQVREPAALFGPWLQALRLCQYAIAEQRHRLETQHRHRRTEDGNVPMAGCFQWPGPQWPRMERIVTA